MPDVLTFDEVEFLREVDRLGGEGLTQKQIAARLKVAPGTITYRINGTRRLKVRRYFRLEEARTGRRLPDLLESGEIVVSEEPALAEAGR